MGRQSVQPPSSPSDLSPKTPSPVAPATRPDDSVSRPMHDSHDFKNTGSGIPLSRSLCNSAHQKSAPSSSPLPLSVGVTPITPDIPPWHNSTDYHDDAATSSTILEASNSEALNRTLVFNTSPNLEDFLPGAPSQSEGKASALSSTTSWFVHRVHTMLSYSSGSHLGNRGVRHGPLSGQTSKKGREASRTKCDVLLGGSVRMSLLLLLCTLCAMVLLQVTVHSVHYRHPHHRLDQKIQHQLPPSQHNIHRQDAVTRGKGRSSAAMHQDSFNPEALQGEEGSHADVSAGIGSLFSSVANSFSGLESQVQGALQQASSVLKLVGHHGQVPATLPTADHDDTHALGAGDHTDISGHGPAKTALTQALASKKPGVLTVPELDGKAVPTGQHMDMRGGKVGGMGGRIAKGGDVVLPNAVELAELQRTLEASLKKVQEAAQGIHDLLEGEAHLGGQVVPEGRANGTYVAMCVVSKNAHHDVCEWLRYHHYVLGVEQFYFYDDGSDVPMMSTIKGCIPLEYIEYQYIHTEMLKGGRGSTRSPQMYAYNHCILRGKALHQWISFTDIDEFIMIHQPPMKLAPFLKQYERYGALGLNWRVFGSSGHDRRPAHGVLASYSACLPADHNQNKHVKTIGNMDYVIAMNHPHVPELKSGSIMVDTQQQPTSYAFVDYPKYDRAFLAHYVLKSRQDYQDKMDRGSAMKKFKTWKYFNSTDAKATTQCTWGRAVSKCVDHLITLEGAAQSCYCNINFTAYTTCVEPATHVLGFCSAQPALGKGEERACHGGSKSESESESQGGKGGHATGQQPRSLRAVQGEGREKGVWGAATRGVDEQQHSWLSEKETAEGESAGSRKLLAKRATGEGEKKRRRMKRAQQVVDSDQDVSEHEHMLDADATAKHSESATGRHQQRGLDKTGALDGEDYDSHTFEDLDLAPGAHQGGQQRTEHAVSVGIDARSDAHRKVREQHVAEQQTGLGGMRESHGDGEGGGQGVLGGDVRGHVHGELERESASKANVAIAEGNRVHKNKISCWEVPLQDLPVPPCNLPDLGEGEEREEKDPKMLVEAKIAAEAEKQRRKEEAQLDREADEEAEKAWAEEMQGEEEEEDEDSNGGDTADDAAGDEDEGGENEDEGGENADADGGKAEEGHDAGDDESGDGVAEEGEQAAAGDGGDSAEKEGDGNNSESAEEV